MAAMAGQITTLTIFIEAFIRAQSKETSKLRVIGLCEGNSPVTSEFPAQRASNAENFPIWWRTSSCVVSIGVLFNILTCDEKSDKVIYERL